MILFTALIIITAILSVIALFILSIGGTLFTLIAADIIVALGIIWYLFFRNKKGKK